MKRVEPKVGMLVHYNAPGWENITGMIYEVLEASIVVDFGRRGFVEFTDGKYLQLASLAL